jgi:hypothetical protein
MNNLYILGVLFILSLLLGYIKYNNILHNYNFEEDREKPLKNVPWQWKFIEIWNGFVNFFLGGLIGYYFISIRLSFILEGKTLDLSDFILIFIFASCLFGHFSILLLNITKGVEAIIKRVLEK